jgi:hypothetical protein
MIFRNFSNFGQNEEKNRKIEKFLGAEIMQSLVSLENGYFENLVEDVNFDDACNYTDSFTIVLINKSKSREPLLIYLYPQCDDNFDPKFYLRAVEGRDLFSNEKINFDKIEDAQKFADNFYGLTSIDEIRAKASEYLNDLEDGLV